MASETIGATYSYKSIIREGKGAILQSDIVICRTNGTDMKAGSIVTRAGESTIDIDPAAHGDLGFLGIILGPVVPADTYDIDDTFADNTMVYVLKPTGGRTVVAAFYNSVAANVVKDEALYVSNDTDGTVGKNTYASAFSAATAEDPSNAEIQAEANAVALAAQKFAAGKVGYATHAVTGHSSDEKIVLLRY